MQLSIPVLLGTSRTGNYSQKVARYLHTQLSIIPEVNSPYLDLSDTHFPLLQERLDHTDSPPSGLEEWSHTLASADGLLIVAPEYKGSYPAALKNLLDYLPPQIFRYTPVAISTVSSGAFGGATCLAQLRLLCSACGGLPIPDRLPVPFVRESFDNHDLPSSSTFEKKAHVFLQELLKYTQSLKNIESQ